MRSPRAPAIALVAASLAAVAAAAPADLSGTWAAKGGDRSDQGRHRRHAGPSLRIDQSTEAVTLAFGFGSRMAMTVRTDGTPRPLKVNGNQTPATIAAHWEGSDLVLEFTPARPGVKAVRTVLRRVNETTLRIEGTMPGMGNRMATRGIELKLQPRGGSTKQERAR